MKFVAFTFVAMLAVLVAGSPTPKFANERDSADIELSPVLPHVEKAQVMFNDVSKRQDPEGCDNHYMIDCGGDYVKSYNCWYWSKTRCWCGKLTSEEPKCLAECKCTHWEDPSVNGAAVVQATSLPVDAPTSNRTSGNTTAPA